VSTPVPVSPACVSAPESVGVLVSLLLLQASVSEEAAKRSPKTKRARMIRFL
jgi:hypothetical protein